MSDKKELFRNLLLMAAADGKMAESELQMLSDRAIEWGITDDEFEDSLKNAMNGKASLSIPKDKAERKEALKDMVRMMAADGQMSEGEKKLFATVSAILELSADDLNSLIDEVLEEE